MAVEVAIGTTPGMAVTTPQEPEKEKEKEREAKAKVARLPRMETETLKSLQKRS